MTNTVTETQAWGRDGLMALAAFRYCCGRQTYIVSDCADWLISVWDLLPANTKAVIQRDLEEAFNRDDDDRAHEEEFKTLGADCDRASWEKVRALWKQ